MVGIGLDTKYCLPAGTSCDITHYHQVTMVPCNYDYRNVACSTGACYLLSGSFICDNSATCTGTGVDHKI